MKRELIPRGFIKSAHACYARKQGNQIHLIHFDTYGGEYTLNLGFHYDFLLPHLAWKRIEICNYHFLHCALRSLDPRIDCGNDRHQLEATLVEKLRTALKVFGRYGKKWASAESWLMLLDECSGEGVHRIGKWYLHEPYEFFAGVAMEYGRWHLAEQAINSLLADDCGSAARKYQARVAKCLRQRMSRMRADR